jgi:hypothetical protein
LHCSTVQKGPASGTNSEAGSLPCLNSNISTGTPILAYSDPRLSEPKKDLWKLSTQHRKTAFVLTESVYQICQKYGIERVGFLTLTFADHVTSPREAQRRLNSLLSHVIKVRYLDYVGVFERMKSGRIHYHLLVALDVDIRTGFDFDGVKNHDYRSASDALRKEWAFWRKTAPKYRFGRTELLPIKSTIQAMGKYVGKYISKHMLCRNDEDKGARLVRYSHGARAGTTRFQFNSPGSAEWRRKTAIFAQIVQDHYPETCINTLADLTRVLGPRWAYLNRDFIHALP